MSRRFFAADVEPTSRFRLDGDQAHHILHVMRFGLGDQITLFDGQGHEYAATITETEKKHLFLDVVPIESGQADPKMELTIAVALPKGDRQKFMVEKLVELGVDRLIPLSTQRSVAEAPQKVIARLQKQVVEACKQSGRNRLMEIAPQTNLQELESGNRSETTYSRRLIATPKRPLNLDHFHTTEKDRVIIAVGPEGGFSEEEQHWATENSWTEVCVSDQILRIETAAIATSVLARSLSATA